MPEINPTNGVYKNMIPHRHNQLQIAITIIVFAIVILSTCEFRYGLNAKDPARLPDTTLTLRWLPEFDPRGI